MPTTRPTRPARPSPARLLLAVALRAGTLIALYAVVDRLAPLLVPDDDGLGTGLLFFALSTTVCSLVGVVDAVRWSYPRVVVVWVASGALVAVAATLLLGPGGGPGAALADLRESGPFIAQLVAVPALLTGGLAALVSLAVTRLTRAPRAA